MPGGPIALFDKSFLQSLSLDESVLFDQFFFPVICPIFYIETLADLEKSVREGRTPEQEVGIIADKVPEMSGGPCAYHRDMVVASLFGAHVPMDGRIPTPSGRPVKVDGKSGFVHGEAPEAEAFRRWQNREFLYIERQFVHAWRRALEGIDLTKIATSVQNAGITAESCKSLVEAKQIADGIVEQGSSAAVDHLNWALSISGIPPNYDLNILARWICDGRRSIRRFAAYAAHVLSVELFFQIALGARLIGTSDRNNRTDIAYLFYAPFCHVFVSSDNLHRRCAPLFLRSDQSFVWGGDLKADLARLVAYYAARPEEEKEKGLTRLAPTPPKEADHSLVVQLWDKHLLPLWRNNPSDSPPNPDRDSAMVEHINKVTSAPTLPPERINFHPDDADFVCLERRIMKKRGSWWQLPKNLST